MAESLSIDGTDLASVAYAITGYRGLVGAPPKRGGDYEVPRRSGALGGVAWGGPRIVTVYGVLYGNNGAVLVPADARARYLDRARQLSALVYRDGKVFDLTRVIPRQSGGDLTTTVRARYLAGLDSIEQAAFHAGRFAVDLYCFDANWHALSDTTLSAITGSSSPSIAGDVATRKVTLTFSGVTGIQRLTNATTGDWVEVLGDSADDTVLDCENFTATRDAASVTGLVDHNGATSDWMTLAAGTNALTLTGGGSVTVAYRGAYL